MVSCDAVKKVLMGSLGDMLSVEVKNGTCIVVLPLPDDMGEPVRVYVRPHGKGVVMVSDLGFVYTKYREAGFNSGETPDREKFEELIRCYDVNNFGDELGYTLEPLDGALADKVWRLANFISEATHLTLLARHSRSI